MSTQRGKFGALRNAIAMTAMLVLGLCGEAVRADDAPWRVVVLNVSDPLLPAFVALDRATREEIHARTTRHVEFFAETLDMLRFPRANIELETLALLQRKYRDTKVDVVLAMETTALDFAERHGEAIWPGAPIVFNSVPATVLVRRALGPRTTGVPVQYDIGPTLDLALRLRPATRRVVAIAGAGEFDQDLARRTREAAAGIEGKVEVEILANQSLAEARARVGNLAPDSIVLYLSMFRGGDGTPHRPRYVLSELAAVSRAPIFGIFETYLDGGIVAGSIASFAAQGRRTGELIVRILRGESAAALGASDPVTPGCIADWRELRRWGIDERLLPVGCEVRFREVSVWERYRWQIDLALLIMFAQAALIAALLFQRYRRRRAEQAVQQLRGELAHAGRLATIGEITAAIAHEVNQPLGAILTNVDSAEMLLEADNTRLEEVRQILGDIRKDDLRASEIIRRLRALLAKHEMARERIDLNETIAEVLRLLDAEAQRRQMELVAEFDAAQPRVFGDRVHLQQVLLNLVVNAMDAMADTQVSERQVRVRTALRAEGSVEISVADRGHGIAAERLPRLFESFFTTKPRGMGLGLSIARSIVEAHGGRIAAENNAEGGATFRLTLPVAAATLRPSIAEQPA